VGQIVRKNPLPLLIPCHRVIGSNGKNIGFMGIRENPMQMALVNLEKRNKPNS
jgi:O6-methylguanine-DNA--protein-cysteine methyltransferase